MKMSALKLAFVSALPVGVALHLFCIGFDSPSSPDKTNASVVFMSSTSKIYEGDLVDSVGKEIRIGTALYLPSNFDSVAIQILDNGNTVVDTVFTTFRSEYFKDTVWVIHTFLKPGVKNVTLTPYSTPQCPTIGATITIHGVELQPEDTTPPALTLVTPSDTNAAVSTDTFTIDLLCSDSSGVASVSASMGSITFQSTLKNGHYTIPVIGFNSGEINVVTITAIDSSASANTASRKLYFKYDTSKYSVMHNVVYAGNGNTGGTIPVDSNTYTTASMVTVKDNTGLLTKTGLTFKGWNTVPDGSGIAYPAGVTFVIGSVDVILYAQWIPKQTFALTITAINGSVIKAPELQTYDSGTVVTLTPIPAAGYHFTGWSGALTGATNPATLIMNSAKSVTAEFAKNQVNSFALIILATNGTVKKTPDLPQYDSGYTVGLKATPADGFIFVNWSGDAAGTADSTTVVISAAKSITANFVPLTYQLTASAGIGGTITAPASSPVAVNHAAATTITATPNSGYRFSGWSVTSGTATFGDTSSASTAVTLSSGNATVTANFTRITYQLTGTSETGGIISTPSSPATVNHGVATTITATPGAGYSFNGWVVASGSAAIPDLTSATTTATLTSGNAEIKAQWTAIPYSIIYTLNGGEQNGGSYPAIYSVNTSTITLANPTKTAYVFDGWHDNSELSGNRMATIPQGSTGNKTLYAKWSIKDIDGNYYTEVKIGNQYWMVENLKTSKYNDGELIPHLRAYDWKNADLEAPKWCWHADNSGYKKYGGLYTYNVAGNEKIAPDGWRVADSADFENARSFIEENYSTFTPFLAGLRGADGVDTFFNEKQYWWIGKEMMGPSGSQLCFMWGPAFDSDEIILSLFSLHRFTGASIRCVRDE